jgi:DMSO/TMAO reductase YedYZ molybdopterin-dependent catalytic subunit
VLGKYFKAPDPSVRDRVPPGQYLAEGFPVMTYGETPARSPQDWTLKIWGLVEREIILTWADLQGLPQQEFTADFHCVTHWSKLDVVWGGVSVLDVMAQVAIAPTATHIMQHCDGGYSTNLPLGDFLRTENFLAHTLNGEPLPIDHGGPVRSVVPHLYAWKSAKWISGLELLPADAPGFWERNGYHKRGNPWDEERYSD